MIAYIIRRSLYALPILIGVNVLTFVIFFIVNSPDDMARAHLGSKHIDQEAIEKWKRARGYDNPIIFNEKASGIKKISETIFFQKSLSLFIFNFGQADDNRDIGRDIIIRFGPSLAIALPTFIIGLGLYITLSLLLIFFRHTYVDFQGVVICVIMMSVSSLFYIIGGQFIFGKLLRLVPISGFDGGVNSIKFVVLPIIIGVIYGIGSSTRLYRTIFLEEIEKDYVRTARSKGLSEIRVLFHHVLKNGLIPILTSSVAIIPLLFMGSLIMESFFGIPGLGSYTIDAIRNEDFAIVRAMVFLGSFLYILGLLMTDISYTLVDPRIRLE
ncbi:ABC transporter permease [Thermodesulfobacteriota bacterium]